MTQPGPDSLTRSTNSLRILVVDDNHVNLAVLSTLLKRRFGHLLACPPVALDSGLKAIQALRTDVFDVIFMDIEMPYLNGVECTRRIRAGEDGILQCNSSAQIVAVTTKVGDEPGKLYRQVGMDGMISKPVRFEHFRQYLCPLSTKARHQQMPPVQAHGRVFFTPIADHASAGGPASAVSSDDSGDFAAMLKEQTTKSLRDRRAISTARTGTISLPRRSSFNSPRSEHQGVPADSFNVLIDLEADSQDRIAQAERPQALHRPVPVQRLSSPAYMLDRAPSIDSRRDSDADQPRVPSDDDAQYEGRNIRHLKLYARRAEVEADKFDTRASASLTWSHMQFFGLTTDSDTRNTSPSSAATTPLSSPSECEPDWQDVFSKAEFGTCADDLASPNTKTVWNTPDSAPASQSG